MLIAVAAHLNCQMDRLASLTHLQVDPSTVLEDSLVASAGFADIYKGKMSTLGPRVAIKKLRPHGDRNARMRVAAVSLASSYFRYTTKR